MEEKNERDCKEAAFSFFHFLIENSIGYLFADTYYYFGAQDEKPEFVDEKNRINKGVLWNFYIKSLNRP